MDFSNSSSSPLVSIIIRTKNEEKWISTCLKSVFSQTYPNFEVIVVDNKSTDMSIKKAKAFDVSLVEMKEKEFLPGKAINKGIMQSKGAIIVCLSGHCIPVHNNWLANLIRNFEDENIAGVYGRQEPMSFSSDADKRDLLTVFGLDRKEQKKDSFFHNANSAIRRDLWEKIPFDDKATNIEDRIWAKELISRGFTLVYEPEASVYHYHGIHQNGDIKRCRSVVKILEELDSHDKPNGYNIHDIQDMNIVALIPVKGMVQSCGGKSLLEYTVRRAQTSKYINKVIVSTDDQSLADLAIELGVEVPFLRPPELSMEYVDLSMVLQYSLNKIEEIGIFPDIVVVLEVTYPFRPEGMIDKLIKKLVREGLDSVVPVKLEYRTVWKREEAETKIIGQGFMPRRLKKNPLFVNLLGLGFVTLPNPIREGKIMGDKVGIMEVSDPFFHLEVRDEKTIDLAGRIIDDWWAENEEAAQEGVVQTRQHKSNSS